MGKASTEGVIQKSADEVWAKIGRFEDMSWHHRVAACKVADGIRYVTMQGGGAETTQRLYAHDDANRTMRTASIPMLAIRSRCRADRPSICPRATISITPSGEAARVVRFDVEIEDGYDLLLQGTISGYRADIEDLKRDFQS